MITGGHPTHGPQGVIGRPVRHAGRRGHPEFDAVRDRHERGDRQRHLLGEGTHQGGTHHPVADAPLRHAGADRSDSASEFAPGVNGGGTVI